MNRYDLFTLYNQHNLVGTGVEVGVKKGRYITEGYKTWKGKTLYLIDIWKHLDDYDDTGNVSDEEHMKNLAEVKDLVKNYPHIETHILRMFSKDAVTQFEDLSLDWVYLDANHAYSYIKEDINNWWRKVKKGGILAGHDYNTYIGVRKAVNEFVQDNNQDLNLTEEGCSSWWIIKN